MNQLKKILALSIFSFLIFSSNVSATLDLIKTNVNLNKDYTFTQDITVATTVTSPQEISDFQSASQEFFPTSQELTVEAYVIHPDGEKVIAPASNITIELSPSSQDDPGFTNSHTMHVLLPQLRMGSRTYVTWKIIQTSPLPIGYTGTWMPPFYKGLKNFEIKITSPHDLKLFWKERGGFKVKDSLKDGNRTIEARFENASPHQYQNSMPNPMDLAPVFVVSAFSTWEELSAKSYEAAKLQDTVSPQIRELSKKIVGNKKGKEAAEAIYNWVAQNIQYVAVYLNMKQEFIPLSAEEVWKNGYGDCKGHVILMQALLKAQDIPSFQVLVYWGNLYKTLPLASESQFNHMMIYLPDFNLFANPTNPLATFGELGQGLDGKFVLVITPEGKTAHLPLPKSENNLYKNHNIIEILPDGTVRGHNTITSTGNMNTLTRYYFSDLFNEITSLNDKAQLILSTDTNGAYGTFTLSGSPYDLSTPFSAKGAWTSPHSFSLGEETAFFWIPIGLDIVNPHAIRDQITPRKRLYPLVSDYFPAPGSIPQYIYPGQYVWSYEVKLPENYTLAQMPSNVFIKSPEGSYKSTYRQKGGQLLIERTLIITKFYLNVKEYNTLRPILYKLENDFNAILMLKKK